MRPPKPIAAVKPEISYRGHRFPRDVIALAVWLYYRFPLNLRMVEEMLAAHAPLANLSLLLVRGPKLTSTGDRPGQRTLATDAPGR